MNPRFLPSPPGLKCFLLSAFLALLMTGPSTRAFTIAFPPVVSDIPDITIQQGTSTGPVTFLVTDIDSPATSLTVTATCDNPNLVPTTGISLSTSRVNVGWSISITPSPNLTGKATITVVASDGRLKGSDSFVLTVQAPNTAPSISTIQGVNIPQDGSSGPIVFFVNDAETQGGQLAVNAFTDFTTLFPKGSLVLGGTTGSRTLTVTPAPGISGSGFIVVTVSDGQLSASTQISVTVQALDFGDAPDSYRTLMGSDGARHGILKGFNLGKLVDSEPDGLPGPAATGDDLSVKGASDEDGVLFPAGLVAGQTAVVQVEATTVGRLDAWVDFNGNGGFGDPGERVFTTLTIGGGVNVLKFDVPSTATIGATYARFRFSREGVQDYFGAALDGEVEDYAVQISSPAVRMDFGDAPDSYRTKLGSDGARHVISEGFNFGKFVDSEVDGQPSLDALGDDGPAGAPDDEDGVALPSSFVVGDTALITIDVTGSGRLDAWIDFNGNGDFADAGERIFTTEPVVAGSNQLKVQIPTNAKPGATYARFRLSREGVKDYFGLAADGEVEDYLIQIAVPQPTLDFGDAPDTYQTTLAKDGARHVILRGFNLGKIVDPEFDGQPTASALGDDGGGTLPDDEDGVLMPSSFVAGQSSSIAVEVTATGRLDAWMDFDGNGDFAGAGERIMTAVPVTGGINSLTVSVPTGAKVGSTYARFRLSREGVKDYFGSAPDGEVEDYLIQIDAQKPTLDFGDAPDTYRTTLEKDGARHTILRGFNLGKTIDAEFNGQPSADARGDDGGPNQASDEDGVTLPSSFVLGQSSSISVESTAAGRLDAWIDFDGNGDFAGVGERIMTSVPVAAGFNSLSVIIPTGAKVGSTYARFRLSREGVKDFFGLAADGEVEDYLIQIAQPAATLDFGDAPDTYRTTLERNGARHTILKGLTLGKFVDAESDGQPSADALGDDGGVAATVLDDEDGVTMPSILVVGQSTSISVEVVGAGRLDAWMDFNANGDFADAGEHIIAALPVTNGFNPISISIPSTAAIGKSYARFRLSRQGVKDYFGPASEGEVEDYLIQFGQPEVRYDFGDAPQPYPTVIKDNGARHRINPDVYLGLRVDPEADGQPNAGSTGDDINPPNGVDDEDGVKFSLPLVAGQSGTVVVRASTQGRLWAWIDFYANGDWADVVDRVFNGIVLNAGDNTLTFQVPPDSKPGPSFSRFRFTRATIEGYVGEAPDGEVEDHPVRISAGAPIYDYGDAPEEGTSFATTIARKGAYHLVDAKFHLGASVDSEADGQPNVAASGDDTSPTGGLDDEDGVQFMTPLIAGSVARIEVTATTRGMLDAWIDFNLNRSWNDPGEKIFSAKQLVGGVNVLSFNVPASVLRGGPTYARFRFSKEGGLGPEGYGGAGEVEDYLVRLERPAPCDLGCNGVDFWLAFPGNYAPDPANPVKPYLTFIGAAGTQVTIQIAGLGYNNVVAIPAAGTVTVLLPKNADLGDANDVIEKKGVHITASAPVAIHALSQVKYTSDGYTAIATEVLGTEYIVLGYGNVHSAVPELNGTQFAVVGTENATQVTIIPSEVTGSHDSGFPYSIILQAGETYQLRNTNDAPRDLTGTIIVSDKPIAVFAGHQVANVRSHNAYFADYLVEEMLPVQRWGTDFFARPLAIPAAPGSRSGYLLRVLASQNNTHVFVNGVLVGTLDRGEHLDRGLVSASRVLTTKPALVAQYAFSSDVDGVVNSDPFMVLAQQRNLFNKDLRFSTATAGFLTHHINLIVPTAAIGSVQLDGAGVAGPFAAIGASGYSHATVQVGVGVHRVIAAQPVGVMVYGWNEYESYAWPACPFFGDTTPPDVTYSDKDLQVTLGSGTTTVAGNTGCKVPVPDLRSRAQATDNCLLSATGQFPITQDPPPGTLVGVGTHDITLSATDAQGNVGTYVVKFTVIDPNPTGALTLTCPQNMIIPCTETNGAIANFEAVALRGCTPIPLACIPASGSFFEEGTTTVNCVLEEPDNPLQCSFTITVKCGGRQIGIKPSVAGAAASLTLDWGTGAVLEASEAIEGPWSAVEGATAPFTVVPQGRGKFFRIRE